MTDPNDDRGGNPDFGTDPDRGATDDAPGDFESCRETRPDASSSAWLRARSEPAWSDGGLPRC